MNFLGKHNNKHQIVFILLLVLSSALSLYLSTHSLTVTHYSASSTKLSDPIRIVLLSDLHNSEFGENNKQMTDKVAEQEPDLILLTGDLLNQNEERTDVAEELIRSLAPIAPVYVSYGNHEKAYEELFGADLRPIFTEAGAAVLEYDWRDITVKGQDIRLGGLYGYCLPASVSENEGLRIQEYAYLKTFQDTDSLTLLMCHMPVSWIEYGSLDEWDVDCVFCGHAHGGQVRFPLIGGLYAPDQGWFPGRVSGLYRSGDGTKTMVLSRGLGSMNRLPRFNNIPEILVLDMLPG